MIFLCRGSVTEACHDSREVLGLQQQQAVGVIRQSLYLESAPYRYPDLSACLSFA